MQMRMDRAGMGNSCLIKGVCSERIFLSRLPLNPSWFSIRFLYQQPVRKDVKVVSAAGTHSQPRLWEEKTKHDKLSEKDCRIV